MSQAQSSVWSPEQLVRLEYEWRRLQRSFAYHPYVRIVPIEGDPPTEYQFEFRIRTLAINGEGQLDYLASASVAVRLPPEFPHAAPVVKPLEAIFHPNVDSEMVQVVPAWTANNTLADLVSRLGALLCFQTYDPHNLWNPVAMEWLTANADYVPTDPNADFNPELGGDPLDRICRSGAATLSSLRDQVQSFCESLLEPDHPPTVSHARYFAQRTRLAASMFLANDIPEHLSGPASALDEWAIEMAQALPAFEVIRKLKSAAAAARTAAGELSEISHALGRQLTALEEMVGEDPSADPRQAIRQLPLASGLQKSQGELRGLLQRAEQKLHAATARLQPLAIPQRGKTHCAPLESLFEIALGGLQSAVHDARQRVEAATAEVHPILHRAQLEVAALDRILIWREYTDMKDRAIPLVRQLTSWGSGGTQAFFVVNRGGQHGPFEFEQQLDLGSAKIAVRNIGRRAMEAIDTRLGLPLARAENGELLVSLPGDEAGHTFATVFKLTARCDDLAVQLDYLIGQTRALLQRIGTSPLPALSWCGKFAAALARPEALSIIHADYWHVSAHWQNLTADLQALEPLKERMATYHLLMRATEAVPHYQKERAQAETRRTKANGRIAEILGRSSRNVETDQTIIPGKYLKEYEAMIDQRDAAGVEIKRLDYALKLLAGHVQARLQSPLTTGLSVAPQFTALTPLPEDLLALANEMNDEVVNGMVADLGKWLNVPLAASFPAPPAAPPAGAAPMEAVAVEDSAVSEEVPPDELIGAETDETGDAAVDDEIIGDWPGETPRG